MFTGIITHLGKVKKRESFVFTFETDKSFCTKIETATSVSINGSCLTVTHKTDTTFTIVVVPETINRTMLGKLQEEDVVNLELPMSANDLLSGHIVQGHVDGTGRIAAIKEEGNSRIFTITITDALSRYLVEKGSVAVNGISLTVVNAASSFFTVAITPFTWEHTTLHKAKIGELVNIEVDVFAKYVERALISYKKDEK
jgi:riboflavin synthase